VLFIDCAVLNISQDWANFDCNPSRPLSTAPFNKKAEVWQGKQTDPRMRGHISDRVSEYDLYPHGTVDGMFAVELSGIQLAVTLAPDDTSNDHHVTCAQ